MLQANGVKNVLMLESVKLLTVYYYIHIKLPLHYSANGPNKIGSACRCTELHFCTTSLVFRYLVPVPSGMSGLPGSDPGLGGGGATESSNQGGSPLRMAASYSGNVDQQVHTVHKLLKSSFVRHV